MIGVTQLHDIVYILCQRPSTISRFNATTHQRLTDIDVIELSPWDIVACELTSHVYVVNRGCVWRMSEDCTGIQRWVPKSHSDTFQPRTVSVTAACLLVTLPFTLMQFDKDGNELRRVQLSANVKPRHAVESPSGSFIVSCYNRKLEQDQIIEVNTGGEVQRQFRGSHLSPLGTTPRVAVDSRGNIFIADRDNRRILTLRRVIVDEDQPNFDQPNASVLHRTVRTTAGWAGVRRRRDV